MFEIKRKARQDRFPGAVDARNVEVSSREGHFAIEMYRIVVPASIRSRLKKRI